MTLAGTTRRSWRAPFLVALCSTAGTILLGVWVAVPVDRPSSEPVGVGVAASSGTGTAAPASELSAGTRRPSPALAPVRLEIPAIGLTTALVRLGLMPDRTVQVPTDPDRAGWFHPGASPGESGSAVILGHVDSALGPAVFARLQELRPGDAVRVERADGSTVRFVVRETSLYANDDFPALRVYADPHGHRLNLVTCGGAYDSGRGGYQSNLVVYTRRAPARAG